MSERIKAESIVFLITGLGIGGAEAELVQLARRLTLRGWSVRVISMIQPAGREVALAESGIPVTSLAMKRGVPDPRALLTLVRLLRRWQPDVLHGFMVHANLLARLSRLIVRTPVVISTAQNVQEGGRLRERLYRWTDRLTDVTTQVSVAGAKRYVEVGAVPEGRMEVIPNSIDSSRYRPDPEARGELRRELGLGDRTTWLAVGSLEVQKDYPTLLEAVAAAEAIDKVLIAGQGPQRAALEESIVALSLGDRVELLGLRPDVPRLLNAADGYVMSSAWEGTPLALLEAAATGLPIVATDVGGNAEVVGKDGGRLVPSGDPARLARALTEVSALAPEERKSMGLAARERVIEHYDLDRNTDRWEALYQRLWQARRKR